MLHLVAPQVIGAVVDVEFDDVEDVPDILNALRIKVNIEKYNKKNDEIRTVSLLPKQVRLPRGHYRCNHAVALDHDGMRAYAILATRLSRPPRHAQIREAKARRTKLVEAEKDWIANGTGKKVATETLKFVKDLQTLDDEAMKKLEAALGAKANGAYA